MSASAPLNVVDYLVVAGGGGGGFTTGCNGGAGGGGAGGYRESSGTSTGCYSVSPLGSCVAALPVSAQAYPITVGGGGPAGVGPPSNPNDPAKEVIQFFQQSLQQEVEVADTMVLVSLENLVALEEELKW